VRGREGEGRGGNSACSNDACTEEEKRGLFKSRGSERVLVSFLREKGGEEGKVRHRIKVRRTEPYIAESGQSTEDGRKKGEGGGKGETVNSSTSWTKEGKKRGVRHGRPNDASPHREGKGKEKGQMRKDFRGTGERPFLSKEKKKRNHKGSGWRGQKRGGGRLFGIHFWRGGKKGKEGDSTELDDPHRGEGGKKRGCGGAPHGPVVNFKKKKNKRGERGPRWLQHKGKEESRMVKKKRGGAHPMED